jgi:hypothetical protein
MRLLHSSTSVYNTFKSQAAPAVARGQTPVRTLLSCMRRPPRYGLREGSPRAAQSLLCVPARRSSPKLPMTASATCNLLFRGFRLVYSGPQISKRLIVQELGTFHKGDGAPTQSAQMKALKGYHQALRGGR